MVFRVVKVLAIATVTLSIDGPFTLTTNKVSSVDVIGISHRRTMRKS